MRPNWAGFALTPEQMRAMEESAVAAGETTFATLMEAAGAALVDTVCATLSVGRAVILCGPGSNGGDGFVVARLLQKRGWSVTALMVGDADRLTGAARRAYNRWIDIGTVQPFDVACLEPALDSGPTLVVDALFGSGLNRPLDLSEEAITRLARWRESGGTIVAADIPSGLCARTGAILGQVVRADLTVAFHKAFVGQATGQGPGVCGRLHCVPIGLPEDRIGVPILQTVGDVCPPSALDKAPDAHKYDHGHAMVLSGDVGRGGAARLSARAALRVGAGAVTLGCPPAAVIENAAQLTAVMLQPIKDADALSKHLSDRRINALCLGPGLGTEPRELDLLRCALLDRDRGLVLDADALTLLSRGDTLLEMLHPNCVLTPHGGEFARMFPDLAARSGSENSDRLSRVEITQQAAARAGCNVLLKGPDTVIAAPDGRCAIHAAVYERAVPWLATAGSGDVLAGLVTGLLARGFGPFEAASVGAVLHAEAGRIAGPGLIAEDLPEVLPTVLRAELDGRDAIATDH